MFEAKQEELLRTLKRLLGRWDDFNSSNANMEQAYYILAKYAHKDWEDLRRMIINQKQE